MSAAARPLHRLLVPLDGTPVSRRVLDFLEPVLARAEELHLLRVARPGEQAGPAAAYLGAVASALAPRLPRTRLSSWVDHGDPASRILAAAARLAPDLVAMATHGPASGASATAYGSVAAQVARRCPAPSLVLNPLTHRRGHDAVRRILVPFDASAGAVAGLATATGVARAYGAAVTLAFVERGQTTHANVEPHRLRLEQAGLQARAVALGAGRIAARLLDAVEDEGADLVVAATGGREGVVRWALGPIGEELLRGCRRPLLLRPVLADEPGLRALAT